MFEHGKYKKTCIEGFSSLQKMTFHIASPYVEKQRLVFFLFNSWKVWLFGFTQNISGKHTDFTVYSSILEITFIT